MADIFTKEKRSLVMAAIRSTGNRDTELKLVAVFRLHGITGWRRAHRLFGKPDFVFRKQKLAVFVDGCFWHGCGRHCRLPKTRSAFWIDKITRNKRRDAEVRKILRGKGWKVLRVWEHSLKDPRRFLHRLLVVLDSEC